MNNNFFRFERDIYQEQESLNPSRTMKFQAFQESSWFNLQGYADSDFSGETEKPSVFEIKNVFVIPSGTYEISINKALKSSFDKLYPDKLYLKAGTTYEEIEKEPKIITIEKQSQLDLIFNFFSGSRYLKGENYNVQEDYGKDYSIQINVISGGLYEREKEYAVLKGDINKDGMITIEDLSRLRGYSLGAEFIDETDIFRYDLGGGVDGKPDGLIDALDLNIMNKYLLGQQELYQVEFRKEVEQ